MNEIQRLLTLPEILADFKLEHFVKLLAVLGNPQDGLRYVHVAGTNGKGSTCAMIAQGLQEAGHKTGLYTSPYLDRITERIQLDRVEIPEERLESLLKRVREASEKYRIPTTFFEYLTAAAYLYFQEERPEYVVLETGMGGRLDCTNVVTPLVSVITNVTIDHTPWLGATVEEIAREKAGIIKPDVPLFTNAKGASLDIIKNILGNVDKENINSKNTSKKYIIKENNNSKIYIPEEEFFELGLNGAFQQENARLAAAVLRRLGIDEKTIRKALKETLWAGRLEFMRPNLLVDVAHNAAGMKALAEELKKMKKNKNQEKNSHENYEKIILVVGIMKDKAIKEMCETIAPVADEVIITRPQWDRAAQPEDIAQHFDEDKVTLIADVGDAVKEALRRAAEKGLVVVTGSIFTVSEARRTF